MKTSGISNDNLSVDTVLTLACQKAGIDAPTITKEIGVICINLLNTFFDSWANDGVNLWERQRFMQSLNLGQATYMVPPAAVDVMEVTVGNVIRIYQTTGAPFSLNGNAALAFDNNPATSCVCTAVGDTDAYIGWNYNATYPQSIKYIGIQSNTNSTYTISIQYSYDGTLWRDAVTDQTNVYYAGQLQWICNQVPIAAPYWQIVETAGNTLSIQELYFCVDGNIRAIGQVSNGDYEVFATKNNLGTPSSYTLYRDINPYLSLYPTPDISGNVNVMIYTIQAYIQEVTAPYQLLDLPQRYNDAIINNLAYQIALVKNPEKAPSLQLLADYSYQVAKREDSEKVPLQVFYEWVR